VKWGTKHTIRRSKRPELEGGELSKIEFFMKHVVISIAAKGKEIGNAVSKIGNRYLKQEYVFVLALLHSYLYFKG
jgi:hypothetical protein